MVRDRRFEATECSIVEEGGRGLEVTQRRGAKHVAQGWVAFRLGKTEIFVLVRAVEDHVACTYAKRGRELRSADPMRLEIAEHLVRVSRHGVASHTVRLAEK